MQHVPHDWWLQHGIVLLDSIGTSTKVIVDHDDDLRSQAQLLENLDEDDEA